LQNCRIAERHFLLPAILQFCNPAILLMDYRFGPFLLDAAGFRLLREGTPVPLGPKALDLLFLLASRPAALVSKNEILEALWPDVAISDNALTQVISDVRQALGDRAGAPRYIQTVARRGYRFVAAVESVPSSAASAQPSPPLDSMFLPFLRAWHASTGGSGAPGAGVQETSNVDAHRALTDGQLKLEALDPAQVPAAMMDFNRAITLDPRYAPAYVGRAHARFWRYEASRAQNPPDQAELRAAIADVQRAIELDPNLAEAHAALAMFLVSAERTVEAVAAGRRAVMLEPGNWRHLFRLGVAAWGDERIECFDRVRERYPELEYTYFFVAMVHVARGHLGKVEEVLRKGLMQHDGQQGRSDRFPGRGLHWLLGLTCLASGDTAQARLEFERELTSAGGELYAADYSIRAYNGQGYALLQEGNPDAAVQMFGRALEFLPEHARSLVGLVEAHRRGGRKKEAALALERAERALNALHANDRKMEASMVAAFTHVVAGHQPQAIATLTQFLSEAPPGLAGWTIPVEPLFAPLRNDRGFQAVLAQLADRAK
jgi:DNA-binding winged helix-turn-helix (wHTH) protein/Tfp pilus assembly protein PilF